MPQRAPATCTEPGCARARPCPDHPRRRWANGQRGQPMPPGWDATRRRILHRDPVCTSCASAPATEVHHINPRHLGGSHDDGNLTGLCEACHRQITQQQAADARAAARPDGVGGNPRVTQATPGGATRREWSTRFTNFLPPVREARNG